MVICSLTDSLVLDIAFHKWQCICHRCLIFLSYFCPNNIDIKKLSTDYDGLSGSDLENAVLMAAFKSARHRDRFVSHDYVEEAVQGILKSKNENKKEMVVTKKRVVSEEYAKKQMEKSN